MRIRFTSIEQIKAHQFIGNHSSDHEAFNAIEDFAADTDNTLADRAEALRQMSDRGMGFGRDEAISDATLVAMMTI